MSSATTSFAQINALITSEGNAAGLTPDQIQAAITIAKAEGGWDGTVGDNGTSFGVFQFHEGGQLNAFASWLGVDIPTASQIAVERPDLAIQFALGKGGYLYNSLVAGAAQGASGLNLALYAEQYGQRAAQTASGLVPSVVANITSAWSSLWGSATTKAPPGKTSPPGTTTTTPAPPTYSSSSILGAIDNLSNSIGAIPQNAINAALKPVNAAVATAEQALWLLLGLALVILGFWLMANGEKSKILSKVLEKES